MVRLRPFFSLFFTLSTSGSYQHRASLLSPLLLLMFSAPRFLPSRPWETLRTTLKNLVLIPWWQEDHNDEVLPQSQVHRRAWTPYSLCSVQVSVKVPVQLHPVNDLVSGGSSFSFRPQCQWEDQSGVFRLVLVRPFSPWRFGSLTPT